MSSENIKVMANNKKNRDILRKTTQDEWNGLSSDQKRYRLNLHNSVPELGLLDHLNLKNTLSERRKIERRETDSVIDYKSAHEDMVRKYQILTRKEENNERKIINLQDRLDISEERVSKLESELALARADIESMRRSLDEHKVRIVDLEEVIKKQDQRSFLQEREIKKHEEILRKFREVHEKQDEEIADLKKVSILQIRKLELNEENLDVLRQENKKLNGRLNFLEETIPIKLETMIKELKEHSTDNNRLIVLAVLTELGLKK